MSGPEPPEPSTASWRVASAGPRWGLRFLEWMFSWLPLRGAYLLVIGLAPIWYLHYNEPRYGVARAMARMGRRWPWWAGLRAYAAYTLALVDRHYVRAGRLTPVVEPEGRAALDAAVADPSPLIFLGSHCGSLEMAVAALEAMGRPVRAVAVRDRSAARLLRGVGDSSQEVGGQRSAIEADGTPGAGLKMLRALRSGDILAFKADRVLPGSPARDRVVVDLFGEPAELPRGPAEVARLAKARAWALSVFRTGPGRFRVHADPVDVDRTDAAATTRSWAALFEEHVRRQPDQWFNFYGWWPRDARELADQPPTVPPGMRAAVPAIRGALVAAVVAVVLGLAPGRVALLAGLQGGLLAGLIGMSFGARVDRHGTRDQVARATSVLGPIFAVGLPLVTIVELGPLDLAIATLALVAGAVATLSMGRRR